MACPDNSTRGTLPSWQGSSFRELPPEIGWCWQSPLVEITDWDWWRDVPWSPQCWPSLWRHRHAIGSSRAVVSCLCLNLSYYHGIEIINHFAREHKLFFWALICYFTGGYNFWGLWCRATHHHAFGVSGFRRTRWIRIADGQASTWLLDI